MKELTRKEILENAIAACEKRVDNWLAEWEQLHDRTRTLGKCIKLDREDMLRARKELDQMANEAFVAKAERGSR